MPKRAAVYARVSTGRQAEADLSIPDQLRQAEIWCEQNGIALVRQYIEPGASGTDENRPQFQEMLADVRAKPRSFDIVIVHSLSRFCRDEFTFGMAKRDLDRAGIALHSLTQPLGDDHTGRMVSQILVAFDAYQSRENGKHTARAMRENARQGFWNGSRPPFGYEAVAAGKRGEKIKKTLAILDSEAQIVRRVFDAYLGRNQLQSGIKAIASQLNADGIRHRGKPFSTSSVHRILTCETYAGTHWFNVIDRKSGHKRPRSEWVPTDVPPVIAREAFEQVQGLLASRNPKQTPPRVVSGPTLLTGLAVCARCRSGMMLRTRKVQPVSLLYLRRSCASR